MKMHPQVLQHWLALALSRPQLATTTYIFDEVVTFFNSRNLHGKAVEIGNRLLESPDIELIEIDRRLFARGWAYFHQHRDKSYSLTDCLSFTIMEERAIAAALTPKVPPNTSLKRVEPKLSAKI
jgi:predicted nucleic acid-binding protein